MLMGTFESLIDAKNRYAIPAKFRDELGKTCVLTRGLDKCLILYPMDTWTQLEKKLQALPKSDKNARAFIRFMYANAVECEIDKQGRTVLSEQFRKAGNIDKEIVTIGMLDRVEIWAKEIYEDDANGGKLSPEDLEKFSETYQV